MPNSGGGLISPTRPKARPSDVGWHALSQRLVAWQCLLLAVVLLALPFLDLTVMWSSGVVFWVADGVVLMLWGALRRTPGRPREWLMAEVVLVLALTLTVSHILSPAQYLATALNRPAIDPILAAADARMHVSVPALVAWSRAHPHADQALRLSYVTLLPQFAIIIAVLGIVLRDRRALWEYAFHFHVCATTTVVMLALFPARCAFQYYGFVSTLDQTRFITQFNALRAGTLRTVDFTHLEGLVSMPSFHVAGALMVTWSLRRHPWVCVPFAVVNVALICSTFMTGAHYVVDVPGSMLMFLGSVWLWRRYGQEWLPPNSAPASLPGQAPGEYDGQIPTPQLH